MRKIIASLDVGSSTIKLVVGEIVKNKVNVLVCAQVDSQGIKKGYIVNGESASVAFREVFKKCEDILGVSIKKILVTVPSSYAEYFLTSATIPIRHEDKVIRNSDIVLAMQKCVYNKIPENKELITVIPTGFKVNEEIVNNPLSLIADKMSLKAIAVTVPRKNVEGINAVLRNIGVECIDIVTSPLGDYYQNKTKDFSNSISAIVNIGNELTTVSIFNKGIITNSEVIDIGGSTITNDLAYVYKISQSDARLVKEKLALAHTRLAQPNESMTLVDKHGENVKINQYDASEIVMSRLIEIINLAKKQINLLTKKEISYIIFTGGVTETPDFDILVEELVGYNGIIGHIEEMGARSNEYSTALGMIKYYNSRLKLRNVDYSIFSDEDLEKLSRIDKKVGVPDNSLLGKFIGYFFDSN